MPTYDFRCPKGHKFTHFYKTISGAQSELPCPECGAVAERQLSGGAGFAFKGSGFYLTDYGKNAHRGGEKSTSSGDSAKAESREPKGDGSSKAESPKPKAESGSSKAEGPKPKAESTSAASKAKAKE